MIYCDLSISFSGLLFVQFSTPLAIVSFTANLLLVPNHNVMQLAGKVVRRLNKEKVWLILWEKNLILMKEMES